MTHPGLPDFWVYMVLGFMAVLSVLIVTDYEIPGAGLFQKPAASLANVQYIGPVFYFISHSRWLLLFFKLVALIFFLLVIYAGLFGTPVPEKNIATVLTWNIWWAGLILSIFFLGSAWCAICPWDTLANWHVKPVLWFKNKVYKLNNSLELTPPKWLRNVWPACVLFIILTWLELGYGITTSPYATALLSLLMVVLAIVFLAIFKNKSFCHYVCPVGRTIGFYSQLAPIELRPINPSTCLDCKTLECFNGSDKIDACPTQLVMGSLKQNTYCTSCGNCIQSCPSDNVSWRIRSPSSEAMHNARPHWDEAWFMLVLLSLTSFHGVTMMDFWEDGLRDFARIINDSGQLLVSFSLGLILSIVIPVSLYALVVEITRRVSKTNYKYKQVFSSLVFVSLPLAFAYHIAHNFNHLIRESVGVGQLFLNPLGGQVSSVAEPQQINTMLLSSDAIFVVQAFVMMFGFWLAIKVLQSRGKILFINNNWAKLPMLGFILLINGFHLWMLMQPMVMRVGALCVVPEVL